MVICLTFLGLSFSSAKWEQSPPPNCLLQDYEIKRNYEIIWALKHFSEGERVRKKCLNPEPFDRVDESLQP